MIIKIINWFKKHKAFLEWAYKTWRGSKELRHFRAWLAFLLALAGGNGIYFAINSDKVWNFELSYNSIGLWEVLIAAISLVGFYVVLYFENRKAFNESLEKVIRTQMQLLLDPIKLYKDFKEFDFSHGSDFIQSAKIDEIVSVLKNSEIRNVRILGVSGMGKTYIIQQAFLGLDDDAPVFYCDNTEDSRFYSSLETLSTQYPDGGTLILDNCRYDVYSIVKSRFGKKFRIISAFYDITVGSNDDKNIFIVENDVKEIVEQIIDRKIRQDVSDDNRKKLKEYSGNNTYMALLLVNTFNESNEVGKISDDTLFSKLLYVDGDNQNEYMAAARTLALCQPVGYEKPDNIQLDFLKNNKNITRFETAVDRDAIFDKVIETLEGRNLIEHDATYINLRPQPLAIWLVGEWLKDCKDKRFFAILKDLDGINKQLADNIIDAWCVRLRLMNGNAHAEKVCKDLYDVKNGLFSSEDVVCSDHGSRLFLAMCTVNPVISAEALSTVIAGMSFQRLETELCGDARRNVVRALEKLSFSHSSYGKAMPALAKLAVAENESWSNNARGQFLQLFHVELAGTESTLLERLEILKDLIEKDIAYVPLVVDAIGSALSYGNFVRMGGPEDFGVVTLIDHRSDFNERVQYWQGIRELIVVVLSKDATQDGKLVKIIAQRARQMANAGCLNVVSDYIETMMPYVGGEWFDMRKSLLAAKRYEHLALKDSILLDELIRKLEPRSFITRFNGAMFDILTSNIRKGTDIFKMQEEAAKPFAEEFLQEKLYEQADLCGVLNDKDNSESWQLARWIAKLATASQFESVLSSILKSILKEDKTYTSRFVDQLFFSSEYKEQNDRFLSALHTNGYLEIFVRIAVTMDGDGMEYFSKLHKMFCDGRLAESYFLRFLEFKRTRDVDTILAIAKILYATETLTERVVTTFNFVSECWFMDSMYQNAGIMLLYKDLVLLYPLEKMSLSRDFVLMVDQILEKCDDANFASALNKKLISYMNSYSSHDGLPRLYNTLLTKYRGAVWEDFSKAILDIENYAGFYLSVRYEIGSGFEFGEKCLFAGHNEQIKELCVKNPSTAPVVMASMCPVFDSNGDIDAFHPFVLWLIDNFGTDENVLNELHANMGTFHWTGSTLPLIRKRKLCFESLKNHKYPNVRQWASRCISAESADQKTVLRQEAYNKLRYQK